MNITDKAFALFRAWADRLTDDGARIEWDRMSMADHAEWRRRVIVYEDLILSQAARERAE